MAEKSKDSEKSKESKDGKAKKGGAGVVIADARSTLAKIVVWICTLAAVVLALGAVLVALRSNINSDNPLVAALLGIGDAIDGPFSRKGGLFTFTGKSHATMEALLNWGIAAIIYLVIGRILARLIKP